jgi:hypothetical protein
MNDVKLQYWEEVLVRIRLATKNKKYGTYLQEIYNWVILFHNFYNCFIVFLPSGTIYGLTSLSWDFTYWEFSRFRAGD